MKREFDTQDHALKAARDLKGRFPMLQVKVFDAATKQTEMIEPAAALCCSTLARQSASKVSESVGAHACESNGLLGFSVRGLASSPLDAGCTEACAGHSSNDFESPGLPSYQHFRPSMRR